MEYKQAIVLRADLKMGKGKLVAQGAHASLAAYLNCGKEERQEWIEGGMKKIALKVNSEAELMEHFEKCRNAGLKPALVRDAGHTQVEPGTITCFGAGPAEENKIDAI
ncbi:MAG: peptidyl-tRNA hydrolase Pth2, partial [Candidatus Bilamarchaeaceae archaeon]